MTTVKHNTNEMAQNYCNITYINVTGVDLGVGFGLVQETDDESVVNANYHTMVRMSFQQAAKLLDQLQRVLSSDMSDDTEQNSH